jgi:cytochrome c-type biogenesis protein
MSGGGVVYGGSVLAAAVAGAVALFAPCCISVMLPAYFASSFHNRRLLVAMTFLFAGGVATVVLPIALGAAVLQRLLVGQHTVIWLAGGALLLSLGGYTLTGGQLRLPMPGRSAQSRGGPGPLAVWSLGVFSGVASACCAPVLAGVVALSGLAASFTRALGLGTAYVFGMVAPLFVLALARERRDWQAGRLFRPRTFTPRVGRVRWAVSGTGLASGLLLVGMGAATVWIALTGAPWPRWVAGRPACPPGCSTPAPSWCVGWRGCRAGPPRCSWQGRWACWAGGRCGRWAGAARTRASRPASTVRRTAMSTKTPNPSGRQRPPAAGRTKCSGT